MINYKNNQFITQKRENWFGWNRTVRRCVFEKHQPRIKRCWLNVLITARAARFYISRNSGERSLHAYTSLTPGEKFSALLPVNWPKAGSVHYARVGNLSILPNERVDETRVDRNAEYSPLSVRSKMILYFMIIHTNDPRLLVIFISTYRDLYAIRIFQRAPTIHGKLKENNASVSKGIRLSLNEERKIWATNVRSSERDSCREWKQQFGGIELIGLPSDLCFFRFSFTLSGCCKDYPSKVLSRSHRFRWRLKGESNGHESRWLPSEW